MKTKLILLAFLITGLFSACKKDKPEPDPLANAQELLQNKNWKLEALTLSPAYMGVTDVLSMWDDCERDDLFRFNPNASFLLDAGNTLCYPDDPQQQTGSWNYSVSSGILTFQIEPVGDEYALKLTSVTGNQMVGTQKDNYENVEYTLTWVFQKQ